MALPKGYQQYQNYQSNRIMTASPAQLTLMLYDGAIKYCNLAITAVEKGDIQKAHNSIRKVEDIITEFRSTLNFKYEVAQDFENVYKYLYDRLVEANLHKDKAVLEEVLGHLRSMRNTWEEVMKLAR